MISSRTPFNNFSSLARFVSVFLALILFATPLCAQRPGGTPTKPSPSRAAQKTREVPFEALLSEDSYKIYGEVRNLGQLLSTGGAGEIVEPIMKLADPPSEFKALIKFLNANAETLAASRLMFATWPARPGIPTAFVAIELPSAEEAEKFEPKLNRVLPAILPTPTPTPTPSPTPIEQPTPTLTVPTVPTVRKSGTSVMQKDESKPPQAILAEPVIVPVQTNRAPLEGPRVPQVTAAPPAQPAGPPFVVTRAGSLIFVTDKPFKFEQLRPADSKLLSENQNFRLAYDRFSTEPVFIYVNVALDDKTRPKPPTQEEIAAQEEQARIKAEEEARAEAEKNTEPTASEPPEPMPEPEASPDPNPEIDGTGTVQQQTNVLTAEPSEAEAAPTPTQSQQAQMAAYSHIGRLLSLLSSGESEWPDGIGVAISQETDSYVVRAILIGPQNAKRLTLPFIPQLIAGRGFTSNAPSVLPDDTEVFISASFDLPKTYENLLAQFQKLRTQDELNARRIPAAHREPSDDTAQPAEPFAEFEKKGGFKIEDDLLPALGGEIAIAGSLKTMQGFDPIGLPRPPSPPAKPSPESGENSEAQKKQQEEQAAPMFLISIKDREAARRLMPRVVDGLGMGEAKLVSRTERRDDTELVDFAGVFAYAFVGDFVVISTTAAARRVIDRYLNHQTLSSNSAFRNFTRWQPRDALGQIYISPALMDSYQKSVNDYSVSMPVGMREFLMRLNPVPQAITYAMSNEGFGAIHELHLPKTFVLASVAGMASYSKDPPPEMNEEVAIGSLSAIVAAEETYKATAGDGSYGSLENLAEQNLISKEMLVRYGYNIQLSASRDQFEATATPVEYGKTGRRAFFVDQTGVVRGDDHGGGLASLGDKPAR